MRCEEVMKKDVVSVELAEPARTAAELMRAGNLGFVPVRDGEGRAVGTLTDRDLALRVVADALDSSTPVGDVMTREVVACKPEDDIQIAHELMETFHKSRIIVNDADGKLVGVISLSDLAARTPAADSGETLHRVSEREARPS